MSRQLVSPYGFEPKRLQIYMYVVEKREGYNMPCSKIYVIFLLQYRL